MIGGGPYRPPPPPTILIDIQRKLERKKEKFVHDFSVCYYLLLQKHQLVMFFSFFLASSPGLGLIFSSSYRMIHKNR